MLLKSSSTPLLGSLLPPDSRHPLPFHSTTGFRRTNSEGNLKNSLSHASDSVDRDSFNSKPKKISHRPRRPLLQTIPSFSFYASRPTAEEAWIRVGGGSGNATGRGIGGSGGELHGMEEYYRKMVVENPGNALLLSNYAEFLYQSKGDLRGAEEYYSRAILINDSGDGEILSKYAKLVWELHHDQLRASSYFQRALQASPQDSLVQAAYANFLWETEEDDNDDDNNNKHSLVKEMATQTYTTAATA